MKQGIIWWCLFGVEGGGATAVAGQDGRRLGLKKMGDMRVREMRVRCGVCCV